MTPMKALELKDLHRKDNSLYYRREYSGIAVLETRGHCNELPLSFVIERKAVGAPDVTIALGSDPAWPVVPVVRSIKHLVLELDKSGGLP